MGLPGSGKTTLAEELAPMLNAKRLNADEVRREADDWDFSKEGRKRQAKRMSYFAEQLNELKTENIEPLSSVAETKLRLRKDEIKSKNIREEILKNSPDENKDFFVVPKVVE